jgi:hypothetical protein
MLGEGSGGQIVYRKDAIHPRHQANFRVFDPPDFLAEVSVHVLDPHEKTTSFYDWYSNWTRGYRKQQGFGAEAGALLPVVEDRAPPELMRLRAMAEAPEWTDDPMDADRPLVDPRTV